MAAVVAAGAFEGCVTVLQTGPGDAKRNAMCVLANASSCKQHVESLVAAGVITTVLNVTHSMDSKGKFVAALVLGNFSDHLDVAVVADVVATLVQELQSGDADEEDEFDATRALSRILRYKKHVGAGVAGGAVAALTRVQQNGSQRGKSEASIALRLILEAESNGCLT